MNVETRQGIEKVIARAAIDALIQAGNTITLFDGAEVTLRNSVDVDAIFNAMFSTDEDTLFVNKQAGIPTVADPHDDWIRFVYGNDGWVKFVYGNDGWDVIADHTVNLTEVLKPVAAVADELEIQHG